jgi:hypothetical protein
MSKIVTALNTCERALDALRGYDRRDAAIEALVNDIIRTRGDLLTRLYTGAPAPAARPYPSPVTDPPQADPLYLETELMRERAQLGAEDEPMTREVQHFVREELRRLAEEFRSS